MFEQLPDRREFLSDLFIAGSSALFLTSSKKEAANTTHAEPEFLPDHPTVRKTLETLNPTLTHFLLSTAMGYRGVTEIIDKNFKSFEKGALSRDKLIYNNADKYAGLIFEFLVAGIPYIARLAINPVLDQKSEDSALNRKQKSDIENITSQHFGSLLYVYLYNPFQSELRKVFLDLLYENEKYGNDPRNIPLSIVAAKAHKKAVSGINDKKETIKSAAGIVDYFSGAPSDRVTVPYAIKRDIVRLFSKQGVFDLMSVAFSYPATMLLNFGAGKAVAAPSRFAWYTRDMIERLKKDGHPQSHQEEEFQSAVSYFLNSTTSHLYEGALQAGMEKVSGLGKYSKSNLSAANLRELLGTIVGWYIYYKVQGTLEPKVRSAVESSPRPAWINLAHEYFTP